MVDSSYFFEINGSTDDFILLTPKQEIEQKKSTWFCGVKIFALILK